MSGPLRILLLDDSASDRALVRQTFQRELRPVEIEEASSREEALRILAERTFDVVISDYELRGSTGLEIFDALRERGIEVPVVMLTGTGTEEVAIASMKRGIADYVVKSVSHIQRLPTTVDQALEKDRAERGRRRAHAALRRSELKYRKLVESVPAGILELGADGRVESINGAAREMLGLAAGDDAVPLAYLDLPGADERAHVAAELERSFGGTATEFEFTAGEEFGLRHFLAGLAPLGEEAGRASRLIGHLVDVTDRRRAEEELRQSQRMETVGQIACGLAHNFNNLLTAILGAADLAETEQGAALSRRLEEIRRAAGRGTSLTGQLLAFSRRELLQPTVLDLGRVLTDFEGMLRLVVRDNVDLSLRPGEGVPSVRADPVSIEQIAMNLVINAGDAMPEGGALHVETARLVPEDSPAEPWAVFRVADEGSGMDAATRAQIFDPFFTTKSVGKGTGLGLATVKRIVDEIGGRIEVTSEPGRGSTFVILLPGVEEAEQVEPRPPPALPRAGGETLLVCEDDPMVRRLMDHILKRSGWELLSAGDPRQALDLAADCQGEIQLLIADVSMPAMSGVELARRLGEARPGIRVLLTSGYAPDTIEGLDELGESALFLKKPFSMRELVEQVQSMLER